MLGSTRGQRDARRLRRLLLDPASRSCRGRITRIRASTTARRSSSCAATPSARRTPTRTRTSGRDTYSFRDNLTLSLDKAGRHDVKVGGEYFYQQNPVFLCNRCMGIYDAQGGPVPANIESLFPVWNDVSTWNLAALSPHRPRPTRSASARWSSTRRSTRVSGWFQDDWQISSQLTLNLGLRYDLMDGVSPRTSSSSRSCKARPHERHQQLGPARRRRLRAERPDGDARRRRQLLRRSGSHTAYWTQARRLRAAPADPERRPRRLRRQPVQRPDPDLRAGGADAVHGRQQRRAACGAASSTFAVD